MIRPQFNYSNEVVDYGDEKFHIIESKQKTFIVRRNKTEEKRVYDYLRTLHASFANQRNNQYSYLPFAEVMKRGWFITLLRNLADNGYAIHGFEDLKKFRYTTDTPKFTIEATSEKDHFDLKVSIQWGDQVMSLKEIRQAILSGQDTIMLENGMLGHIPEEWISQYSLLLRTGNEENGILRVSKLNYPLL